MLGDLTDYPAGAACVLFGIIFMTGLESMSRFWVDNKILGQSTSDSESHLDWQSNKKLSSEVVPPISDVPESSSHFAGHSHTCLSVNVAANWASKSVDLKTKHQLGAYMFEFACIVHSFLIGEIVSKYETPPAACHASRHLL